MSSTVSCYVSAVIDFTLQTPLKKKNINKQTQLADTVENDLAFLTHWSISELKGQMLQNGTGNKSEYWTKPETWLLINANVTPYLLESA